MRLAASPLETWFTAHQAGARWDLGGTMVAPPPAERLEAWLPGFGAGALDLRYGSTQGSEPLRAWLAREHACSAEAVLLTHGATEANFLALSVMLATGDEVVLQDPLYGQFEALANALGARIRRWPVPLDPREPVDLPALVAMIGETTRLVVLNTPHNPTGRVLEPTALEPLIRALEATPHGHLLVDEVYRQVTPGLPGIWGRSPRVLAVDAFSKRWGMPGLRLGWLVGPADLVSEAHALRQGVTQSGSRISEQLAEAFCRFDAEIRAEAGAIAGRNRDRFARWLARTGRQDPMPPVGVMALLRLESGEDRDVALRLRARGLFVVPGEVLGCPGTLRVGFGHRDERALDEALDALARFL